ncbi:Dynein regulatory complex protein 11 [Phlyctochytrium bullatum]|nr:Dynein regulatory complex protein 11 [Phlyctochytrium bullatum]
MSNLTFNKLWNESHQHVLDQLEYETPKDQTLVPKERETATQHVAVLYVKYLQIMRKMEIVYDQIVHPQKRRLLRGILVSIIGRTLELRHKLVELELSDFFNFTDILMDLKLTPEDLEVPIPRFMTEEREKDIEGRKTILDTLGAKEFGAGEQPAIFPEIPITDAVKIIQICERARQGRLRAKYMREIKLQAQREKELDGGDDEAEVNQAALKIQKVFKGYKARKMVKLKLQEELVFLAMASPLKEPKHNQASKADANRQRRKVIQAQHEEEYQAALVNTKEKILKVEGPDMKEGMQDNFRQWYIEYRKIHGKFPDFPPDRVWQQPKFQFSLTDDPNQGLGEEDENQSAKDAESRAASAKKADKGGKKDKDAGKGKKGGKPGTPKKGGKGAEDGEEDGFGVKLDDSKHMPIISTECTNYGTKWLNKDESENFAQKHDQEIIKMEKRKEVEAEIKKEVFEVLKEELKNLKLAVDREKNSKSRKGKKGKKGKSAKGKKGTKGGKKGKKDKKGKKGKKGKKEKDLTANRTMESLVEELIQTGILQKVRPQKRAILMYKFKPVPIADVKGDLNLLENLATKAPVIEPTIGELRRVLSEYCILPIGLPHTGEIPGITSALLFGPRGTGKSMMVNAIAAEAGAYLFNLSPKNTMGQFVGKPNVTKMLHMVFKVAKAHPPSIIYIDNIEMVFAKKVPKDDTSDPKRIKKDLLKNVKGLKPEDRVILLCTSWKPWEGEAKAMLPLFSKCLMSPKPDYSSRLIIWRHFIHRKAGNSWKNVNISLLTRMSAGLSAGSIFLVCERVLTERRLKLLRHRPLSTNEFAEQLFNLPPINAEEDKLYTDWLEKTPLAKKRAAMIAAPEDEDDKGKKKGGKGGAKSAGKDKKKK